MPENRLLRIDEIQKPEDETPDVPKDEFSLGIEIEWPQPSSDYYASSVSHDLDDAFAGNYGTRRPEVAGVEASVGTDHMGCEITSKKMYGFDQAKDWYVGMIDLVERHTYAEYNPCGEGEYKSDTHGDDMHTTIGTHTHISEYMPEDKIRWLYKASMTPLIRALCCSSITRRRPKMGRDGGFSYRGIGNTVHGNVVSWDELDGHYEWRLPEPLRGWQYRRVIDFIEILAYAGVQDAIDYARNVVYGSDEDVEVLKRARDIDLIGRPEKALRESDYDRDMKMVFEEREYSVGMEHEFVDYYTVVKQELSFLKDVHEARYGEYSTADTDDEEELARTGQATIADFGENHV